MSQAETQLGKGQAKEAGGSMQKAADALRQAAKQMGQYAGRLIAARIAGRSVTMPFRYMHLGDLATIGRHAAVVKFGILQLRGFIGWLFWSVAHIYFLIGLRNRFIVAFSWLWSYLTFQRGARLIIGRPTKNES